MPPAARAGDLSAHGGPLGLPAVMTVLIGGQPAATITSVHVCPVPPPAGPHPPSVVSPGSTTVLVGGQPAARVGDVTGCGAPIVAGCFTVLIGG